MTSLTKQIVANRLIADAMQIMPRFRCMRLFGREKYDSRVNLANTLSAQALELMGEGHFENGEYIVKAIQN